MRDLLLIRGGTVVTGQASLCVDVLCGGVGEILAVGPDLETPVGCTVIDAGGLLVMPGGVDPLTGIGADAAGFTRSAEALAGGTTTLLDVMRPGGDLATAWRDWWHAARQAHTDVGLHMLLPDASAPVLHAMGGLVARHGVNSFRLSMAAGLEDGAILRIVGHAAELGALCVIEAQNAQAMACLRAELEQAGITGGEACLFAAPPPVEAEATNRAIMLAGLRGAPVQVGPVSTSGAVAALAAARLRGQRVDGHVLAAHLVLDEAVYDPDGDAHDPYITVPPFRDGSHRHALWGALVSGNLGMVASGFSPTGQGAGLADGLAQRMRVVWRHGVQSGLLTAEEFVYVTAEAAARAFNIYPRKGAIMPGADADLVLWDPDAVETSPADAGGLYAGVTLGGRAVQVLRGGVTVWKDGALCAAGGHGAYVPRPAFRPALSARMRHAARLSERVGR
ncbi:amidohydrolase family protein [Komagataeibacter sp. FNDCR2]|uniref:amidohydrolase family protein n=1 Tax=Komagataeibacter sp. FNDCR2 TaxID=2878682 RepID=UPI001E488A1B|nr:amidohydrolase family protein [Komagataeibacter sp. FNDCR2]MCE2576479.1 amidohydrolase family protein [Komagataeibacter sp. FNDCR2]